MEKIKLLTFITVILIAVVLSCIPALAAGLEYTKTIVYWHVLGVDEVKVTLINDPVWTTTNTTGNLTSASLNFTCSVKDCVWVNVSLEGASGTQNDNTPALKIENTGTTNAQVNLSVNVTLPAAAPANCFRLRYINDTNGDLILDSVPAIGDGTNLNTANITLKDSMAPGSQALRVWLFGNFTDCTSQTYPMSLYVWAYFS